MQLGSVHIIHVIRKNSSTVNKNETHKQNKKLPGRQDRPLDKESHRSVVALEGIDLQRWVQEILSLGPKQPVRDKIKENHFLAAVDIFMLLEKSECNRGVVV